MALIHPVRDAHAWKKGPKLWQEFMHTLGEHPNLTRAIGAAQLATGIWWAFQQNREKVGSRGSNTSLMSSI